MTISANARQISSDEAAAIASEILNGSVASTGTPPMKVKRIKTANDNIESAPYYIFSGENSRSFAIISGDDRAQRVLGYSDKATFDPNNVPPQLKALLESYAEQIKNLYGSEVHPSWKSTARAPEDSESVLLETAEWGQGAPYNQFTPEINGVHAPTGCVATAMAIVMKYHNWPQQGRGRHSYLNNLIYSFETVDFSDYHFQWNSLANDSYDPTATNETKELAQVMSAAGKSVDMNYGELSSETFTYFVGHALRNQFSYSLSTEYIHSQKYSESEWRSKLINEIKQDRPVIYHSAGNGVSHAFVCDGYNPSDGSFHFNWGWDGLSNGFYQLSALNPEGFFFQKDSGMVVGIQPDKSNMDYSPAYVDAGYQWTLTDSPCGFNISVENVEKNVPFDVACRVFTKPTLFKGKIGIALTDRNFRIKEILSSLELQDAAGNIHEFPVYFAGVEVKNSSISPDDLIQLVALEELDNKWLIVPGTSEASSGAPVRGNSPRKSTVRLISDQNGCAKYWDGSYSYGTTQLQEGLQDVLCGSTLIFSSPYEYNFCVTIYKDNKIIDTGYPCVKEGTDPLLDVDYGHLSLVIEPGEYVIDLRKLEFGTEEVTVETPGSLETLIDIHKLHSSRQLTIKGNINAKDIWYLTDNARNTQILDLSDCTIHEYLNANEDSEIRNKFQAANCIPSMSFSNHPRLQQMSLPLNLESIGEGAFAYCNIASLDIPPTVRLIENNAFSLNTPLSSIALHSKTPIECNDILFMAGLFNASGKLYVPTGSKDLYSEHPVWGRAAEIIEDDNIDLRMYAINQDGITYWLQNYAATIKSCDDNVTNIILPSSITYNGKDYAVEYIGNESFKNSQIESIIMPSSVISIGNFAFTGCYALRQVVLSTSLSSLPLGCFEDCQNLGVVEIPDNIKFIDRLAFDNCMSLKNLNIHKNLRLYNDDVFGVFYNMRDLESITVHEENPYYTQINNILYSKDMKSLILAAGQIHSPLYIPDGVEKILGASLCGLQNVEEIYLPESVEYMGYLCICHNPALKHIALPDKVASADSELIRDNEKLESITIGKNFRGVQGINYNPNLKDVYLRNESRINLTTLICPDHYLNYYSGKLYPNAYIDDCENFYVPGATKKTYDCVGTNVKEMWQYQIHKAENSISIVPQIDGLEIENVKINGVTVKSTDGYRYNFERPTDLDVVVEFILNGRQKMETHYTPEFNAAMPDDPFSKINQILGESHNDVEYFNLQGIKVSNAVTPGIYIKKSKTGTEKILKK